jgi:hypothetical protein
MHASFTMTGYLASMAAGNVIAERSMAFWTQKSMQALHLGYMHFPGSISGKSAITFNGPLFPCLKITDIHFRASPPGSFSSPSL